MFGRTRAPGLDRPGLTWFNVSAPLSLPDLAGRLVVLDFWTFCCINCLHVLPTLRRVEETFPAEVAVIGVHSPKFSHERDEEAVARAIARYDIRHPVVHDPHRMLWRDYCVRAWPTLVLIAPDGHIVGDLAGEPHPDRLIEGIADLLERFRARDDLAAVPLDLHPAVEGGGRLRFPGKIKPCPLPDGGRGWAVADTGHHQVVMADDEGRELARFGAGLPGFQDGASAEARFNMPEGLACDAEFLWVADTRNHALRRIERATGRVETVAGRGYRGGVLGDGPVAAASVALASPWDLQDRAGTLYFANAGTHQIGAFTPGAGGGAVRAVAGSGAEALVDGPAGQAALAQPSGLALGADGDTLYFADSETSSIRCLAPQRDHWVETLVGTGLFDFGDANGAWTEAQLQHPLGLAAEAGRLYVADSYNSRIRVMDLARRTVSDLPPLSCLDPLCRPLREPAGLAIAGPRRLLVSDTNNHRILELDLAAGTERTWME